MSPVPDLPALWSVADDLDVAIDGIARERLKIYADLLVRKGGITGATAVTDLEGIQSRHLAEGLGLYALLRQKNLLAPGVPTRVVDIGSGGGLPGIPLAILAPHAHFLLVEATSRKAGLLREAATLLALGTLRVAAERAETLAHEVDHRERYDLAISRAVAALPALLELSLPFLRVGGVMAAIKGSSVGDEAERSTRALRLCGGGAVELRPLPLLRGSAPLSVAFVRKLAPTPESYPRRPGMPAKRPL